jgi:hypothetical protein
MVNAPLGEGLVTTNVPAFACLAAFPAFCVAAPGRTSTLTSHCVGFLGYNVGFDQDVVLVQYCQDNYYGNDFAMP